MSKPNAVNYLDSRRSSHRGRLLSEPLGVSLVLAVQVHLLGPQGHAAVTVEVETVVAADIRPLLLQLAVLRLQELGEARLGPLWSTGSEIAVVNPQCESSTVEIQSCSSAIVDDCMNNDSTHQENENERKPNSISRSMCPNF